MFDRWRKLAKAFYSEKKNQFDISKARRLRGQLPLPLHGCRECKSLPPLAHPTHSPTTPLPLHPILQVPDIYDAAKYDTIHNQHLGLDLKPVYKVGRQGLGRGAAVAHDTDAQLLGSWEAFFGMAFATHSWLLRRHSFETHLSSRPRSLPPLPCPQVAKCLAGVVVPNEYGIHPAGKLRIGSMICRQAGAPVVWRRQLWPAGLGALCCCLFLQAPVCPQCKPGWPMTC